MPTPKPKPKSKNTPTNNPVTRFVANEMLGVDDFKRAYNYARKGQIGRAARSLGVGATEFGLTAISGGAVGALTKAGKLGIKSSKVASKVAHSRMNKAYDKFDTVTARKISNPKTNVAMKKSVDSFYKQASEAASGKRVPSAYKKANKAYNKATNRINQEVSIGAARSGKKLAQGKMNGPVGAYFQKEAQTYRKTMSAGKRGAAVVGAAAAAKATAMKKRNTKRGD